MQTVAQANIAQVERVLEGIRGFGYQRKHKETLALSRDELPGLKEMEK